MTGASSSPLATTLVRLTWKGDNTRRPSQCSGMSLERSPPSYLNSRNRRAPHRAYEEAYEYGVMPGRTWRCVWTC
jgi:hypothetical protein